MSPPLPFPAQNGIALCFRYFPAVFPGLVRLVQFSRIVNNAFFQLPARETLAPPIGVILHIAAGVPKLSSTPLRVIGYLLFRQNQVFGFDADTLCVVVDIPDRSVLALRCLVRSKNFFHVNAIRIHGSQTFILVCSRNTATPEVFQHFAHFAAVDLVKPRCTLQSRAYVTGHLCPFAQPRASF